MSVEPEQAGERPFDDLMKKLVAVPKDEVKRAEQREAKRKAAVKAKKRTHQKGE